MSATENNQPDSQPIIATATSSASHEDEGARLLAELHAVPADSAPGGAQTAPDADDAEHFTPRQFIEYALSQHKRTLAESQLPSTLIATFQDSIFRDLVASTKAAQAPQVPEQVCRVAQGMLGETPLALRKLGIGAPAAVATLEELIALGVRDILIVGTGGSLQPALPIGSYIVPTSAIREEGTSFHYAPAGSELGPDAELAQAMAEAVVAQGGVVTFGPVWTTDAPYREMRSKATAYGAMGALAVEMEASALFALAQFRSVRLALMLAISDELFHEWRPGFHGAELRAAQRVIAQAALQVAVNLSKGEQKSE